MLVVCSVPFSSAVDSRREGRSVVVLQELLSAGLRVSKMSLESGVLVVLSAADWALGALRYLSCVGHSGVPLEGVYRPGTLRLEGHLAFCAKVLPFVWAGCRAVWWHAQVFLQEAIDFVVPLSPFGVFDLLEDGVFSGVVDCSRPSFPRLADMVVPGFPVDSIAAARDGFEPLSADPLD